MIQLCGIRIFSICTDLMDLFKSKKDPLPFGLPLPLLTKQQVSLTGDRHLQVHSYLLEFSESLCVVGHLDRAFQWALTEAVSPGGWGEGLPVGPH